MKRAGIIHIVTNSKKAVPRTLLEKFLHEKAITYIEPQRAGTPRGEAVGLFENKYHAALLLMTNLQKKQIAEEIGVSPSLLRKWTTEEVFKGEVAKNCKEFTAKFMALLNHLEHAPKMRDLYEGVRPSLSLEKRCDELADISLYGECIYEQLSRHFFEWTILLLPKGTDARAKRYQYNLMWLLADTTSLPEWQKRRVTQSFMLAWVQRMREIQNKQEETGRRWETMYLLDMLEGKIAHEE